MSLAERKRRPDCIPFTMIRATNYFRYIGVHGSSASYIPSDQFLLRSPINISLDVKKTLNLHDIFLSRVT